MAREEKSTERDGKRLANWNASSVAVTSFQGRRLPEPGHLAGYATLIEQYRLPVVLPPMLAAIGDRHTKSSTDAWQILTPRHAPLNTLSGHLGGNLHCKVLLRAEQTGCPGLLQSLDFDLAERLRDPFRCAGFGGLEEDLRRRLREHGLGVLPVAFFKLAATLEAEHNGVSILAILGDGGMELG